MPYRIPWRAPDDEDEVDAFRAMFRRERLASRALVVVMALDLLTVAFAAVASTRLPSAAPPPPRAGCVYAGCYCRGETDLEPTACNAEDECLAIADVCPR